MKESNPTQDAREALLSAYVDGELPADEAAEIEAWLDESPAGAAAAEELRGVGAILREAAEGWEREVDFGGFWDSVEGRIEAEGGFVRAPEASAGPLAWLRGALEGFVARPALAASAATVLLAVGVGSAFFMGPSGHNQVGFLDFTGSAEIEDLDFERGSAVVYKTPEDLTVIWLVDEE